MAKYSVQAAQPIFHSIWSAKCQCKSQHGGCAATLAAAPQRGGRLQGQLQHLSGFALGKLAWAGRDEHCFFSAYSYLRVLPFPAIALKCESPENAKQLHILTPFSCCLARADSFCSIVPGIVIQAICRGGVFCLFVLFCSALLPIGCE